MMMKDKYSSNYDNIKNNDMIQSTITDKQRVNYYDHNNCRIFQFVESKFNCETIWKIWIVLTNSMIIIGNNETTINSAITHTQRKHYTKMSTIDIHNTK